MNLADEVRELAQRIKREKEEAEVALAEKVFNLKIQYIKRCVENNPHLTSVVLSHLREFGRETLSEKTTDLILKKLQEEGFTISVTPGVCVTVSWTNDEV